MINSAQEARDKLVEHLEKKCPCQNFHIADHIEAAGYLAGLTGPEVKVLIEAVNVGVNALETRMWSRGYIDSMKEALAQYREVVKL